MAIGGGGWFVCPPKVAQQLLFCAACCFFCPQVVDGKIKADDITGDVWQQVIRACSRSRHAVPFFVVVL